ncbi:hypothetical protein KAM339_001270 [Aeromonas caviae]|nr:hypothetical protein KAM339_001270 [Aeromonas caviae]
MVYLFDFKEKSSIKKNVIQSQSAGHQVLHVEQPSQVVELTFTNKRRERAKRNLLRAAAKLDW